MARGKGGKGNKTQGKQDCGDDASPVDSEQDGSGGVRRSVSSDRKREIKDIASSGAGVVANVKTSQSRDRVPSRNLGTSVRLAMLQSKKDGSGGGKGFDDPLGFGCGLPSIPKRRKVGGKHVGSSQGDVDTVGDGEINFETNGGAFCSQTLRLVCISLYLTRLFIFLFFFIRSVRFPGKKRSKSCESIEILQRRW